MEVKGEHTCMSVTALCCLNEPSVEWIMLWGQCDLWLLKSSLLSNQTTLLSFKTVNTVLLPRLFSHLASFCACTDIGAMASLNMMDVCGQNTQELRTLGNIAGVMIIYKVFANVKL